MEPVRSGGPIKLTGQFGSGEPSRFTVTVISEVAASVPFSNAVTISVAPEPTVTVVLVVGKL